MQLQADALRVKLVKNWRQNRLFSAVLRAKSQGYALSLATLAATFTTNRLQILNLTAAEGVLH